MIRMLLSMIIGGGMGVLAAANWPDPNDAVAGTLLGGGGVLLGTIVGLFLEDREGGR